MHDYGVTTDIVRMVLGIGIVSSMFIYERWRLTGGAVVVAGYLALFVDRPLYIVTTLAMAVLTHVVVDTIIARRLFLYGRRRLVVHVMVGMALQGVTGLIALAVAQDQTWLVGLYGIGFLLPGLIAQDMERQGVRPTVLAVLASALLTFVLYSGLLALFDRLPIEGYSTLVEGLFPYSYPTRWLVPAVVLSLVVSALLFERTGVRSGGFVTAAYLALFVLHPMHLGFIAGSGVLVYLVVKGVLIRWTPIFGRTKFAAMVLTGLVFTWSLEILVGNLTAHAFVPFAGFGIISPMIAALIANDGERQGLFKTLAGVATTTLIVFVAIRGVDLLAMG